MAGIVKRQTISTIPLFSPATRSDTGNLIRSKYVKKYLAVPLMFVAKATLAAGIAGGLGIGGSVTQFGGSVSGNAGSSANSSSITSTEVVGAGSSFQHQANQTASGASIGGTIGRNGVVVNTGANTVSNSQGWGATSGDAPAKSQGSIVNGGTAFGDGEAVAGGTSAFTKAKIGAGLSLGGFAQIGSF